MPRWILHFAPIHRTREDQDFLPEWIPVMSNVQATPAMLTNHQLSYLHDLRHDLHRQPELSGEEHWTAARIEKELVALKPDQMATGLGPWTEPDGTEMGGTGIAAVFDSGKEGPSLLFRCELDGLPIQELNDLPYLSATPMKGHLCGHDGHMSILMGLGMRLAEQRPASGRVILMFQPAEETGKGARAVLADPTFAPFMPDEAYALHNLPGLALGSVWLKDGPMCCASRGVVFHFEGKTSHASMPQDGVSPDLALAALMKGLKDLSNGLDEGQALDESYRLVTITHMAMGEPAFGVAPGTGELWATLRTVTDEVMGQLIEQAEMLAQKLATEHDLALTMRHDDIFDACTNAPTTTDSVMNALNGLDIPWQPQPDPTRFSEDFGQFGQHCPATLFLLGSGQDHPQLHNPDFDFPDSLIAKGTAIFEHILRVRLG